MRLFGRLRAPAKRAVGGYPSLCFGQEKHAFFAAEGEGGSARAGPVATRIGWIEVALLSLRSAGVSVGEGGGGKGEVLIKARSSILGAIWASDCLNLLGMELGNITLEKKKDLDY